MAKFSLAVQVALAGSTTCSRVGKLPVMGYDTYNAFDSNYTGELAIEQGRLMKEYGLVDAGYDTFILDDFYAMENRSETGEMLADPVKFPDGMLSWTKTMNSFGISGSAYSSNGYKTCGGYPGSYGREVQDLETWRSWGWTKMVKYDNCYIPYDHITMENQYGRYKRMKDAIDEVATRYHETPFIYSLCQWGWQQPHNWAPRIAQGWRIDPDITPYWSAIESILYLASTASLLTDHYQHGDLDLLEVGNSNGLGTPSGNMTYYEQRTHFTAWALLKSHLLISTDLRSATSDTLEILLNKDLIAINQDPNEGAAVVPFRIGDQPDFSTITYSATDPPPYWGGNSTWGPVFMIINTAAETRQMSFNLTENWAVRAGRRYTVYDMWQHRVVGVATREWTVELESHDVAALLLKDAGPEGDDVEPPCAKPYSFYQCTAPNGSYIYGGEFVEWGF